MTAWWEAFRERGHDVACANIHRATGLSSDDLISRVLGAAETFSDPAALPAGSPAARSALLAAVGVNPVPVSPPAGRLPGADLAPAARALVARSLRLVAGPPARTLAR